MYDSMEGRALAAEEKLENLKENILVRYFRNPDNDKYTITTALLFVVGCLMIWINY